MSMNRIQFQPGMSVHAFHKDYGAEDQCEAALAQACCPTGFAGDRFFAGIIFWGASIQRWRPPIRRGSASPCHEMLDNVYQEHKEEEDDE